MSDEQDDALVRDDIERKTRTASAFLHPAVQLALFCFLVVATWAMCELAVTEREVRATTAETRETVRSLRSDVVEPLAALVSSPEVSAALKDAPRASQALADAAVALNAQAVPDLLASTRSIRQSAARLPAVVATAADVTTDTRAALGVQFADLHRISLGLEGTVGDLRADLAPDQAALLDNLQNLAAGTKQLDVILEDPAIEKIPPEMLAGLHELTLAASNVKVISANGADVTAYVRDLVIPKPYTPTGPAPVRALKRTGRVLWQIVRGSPQLTVVALRLSGL